MSHDSSRTPESSAMRPATPRGSGDEGNVLSNVDLAQRVADPVQQKSWICPSCTDVTCSSAVSFADHVNKEHPKPEGKASYESQGILFCSCGHAVSSLRTLGTHRLKFQCQRLPIQGKPVQATPQAGGAPVNPAGLPRSRPEADLASMIPKEPPVLVPDSAGPRRSPRNHTPEGTPDSEREEASTPEILERLTFPGKCPVCSSGRRLACVLKHVRAQHKSHPFKPDDLKPLGIYVCSCGAPFASRGALDKHTARTKCHRVSSPDAPARPHGAVGVETATSLEPLEQLERLLGLPTTYKPLPLPLQKPFTDRAGELAQAFIENPCRTTLLHFMALVKIGTVPGLRMGTTQAAELLQQYPVVSWPDPKPQKPRSSSNTDNAIQNVEQGRLGAAARVLVEDDSVAPLTDPVIEALHKKHPAGEADPFADMRAPPLKPGNLPSADDIYKILEQSKIDTAPGISGWTVPLLRLACKSPHVLDFLRTVCGMIAAGTCPGADILCTSRVTPLRKDINGSPLQAEPNGGDNDEEESAEANPKIRPIAGGEILYRVCTKALLRSQHQPDSLLPNQLGVGSKGGVEPILRAVRLAADSKLHREFTHFVACDQENAFNGIGRRFMASGIRTHAPNFFRAARWAYGNPTPLFARVDGKTVTIMSSEGTRQGDTLSPLYYSVAVRPLLEALMEFLGPEYCVFAYLDDWYVFGPNPHILDKIKEFWAQHDAPVKLNPEKCKTYALEEVRTRGVELLGSFVGPPEGRAAFLTSRISELEHKLDKLQRLPKQHAQLLLRICLQSNLRHLQRTLDPEGLEHEWRQLDEVLYRAFNRIRGGDDVPATRRTFDRSIVNLPIRMGGSGILSHEAIAPHAFAAASQLADSVLATIVPSIEAPEILTSQHDRCTDLWSGQLDQLLKSVDLEEQLRVTENGAALARRWLSVIPYRKALMLSDHDVQAGLHARTLKTDSHHCTRCGEPKSVAHVDYCPKHMGTNTTRHESIKYAFGRGMSSLPAVTVAYEPNIGGSVRRNDIRISGSSESGAATQDFDVAVISLITTFGMRHARRADVGGAISLSDQLARRIEYILNATAVDKRNRLPGDPALGAEFHPLVLSAGGWIAQETAEVMKRWRSEMAKGAYEDMCRLLAVRLVRARGRLTYFTPAHEGGRVEGGLGREQELGGGMCDGG